MQESVRPEQFEERITKVDIFAIEEKHKAILSISDTITYFAHYMGIQCKIRLRYTMYDPNKFIIQLLLSKLEQNIHF